MRILFFCNSTVLGGAERYLLDLGSALAARGHRIHLAAPGESPLFEAAAQCEGINAIPFGIGPKLSRKSLFEMALHWRRHRDALEQFVRFVADTHGLDLVHLQFKKEQILGSRLEEVAGVPVVWTEHGPIPSALRALPPAMWFYRRAARKARGIVCVSDGVRRHIAECGVSLEAGSMVTVHNGIAIPAPETRDPAIRSALGWGERDPVAINVGRLVAHQKGQDLLLRAIPHVIQRVPNARFLVVGDGPDRARLEAMVEELGIRENVALLGHRDDIPRLLAASDLFVLPSRGEGLSYAAIEAMFAGLPLIVTRVGGMAELVEPEGQCGVVIPPDDIVSLRGTLAFLLDNARVMWAMGEASRKKAIAQFTFDRMIEETESEFRRIAGAG